MILKIKAFIYRHTGIYLAHREELKYVTSEENCMWIQDRYDDPNEDMTIDNLVGLSIGLWQCQHGFLRPFKFK